jgi:hypothetical protein
VGSHWHLLSSLLTAAVVAGSAGNAHAYDCARKYCTRMESCGEAYYKFTVCHQQSLDRDNDGIPCENVCGGDMATFEARLRHVRGALTTPEQDDKAQPSALMQGGAADAGEEAGIAGATCGSKRRVQGHALVRGSALLSHPLRRDFARPGWRWGAVREPVPFAVRQLGTPRTPPARTVETGEK